MSTDEQLPPADEGRRLKVLCSIAQTVELFDPAWIKTSDWPANIIPAGAIAIDQTSDNGDCTVKGSMTRQLASFTFRKCCTTFLS